MSRRWKGRWNCGEIPQTASAVRSKSQIGPTSAAGNDLLSCLDDYRYEDSDGAVRGYRLIMLM